MGEYIVTTEDGKKYRVKTEDSPEPDTSRSVGGFASNVAKSAGRVAGDVAQTAFLPVTGLVGAAGQLKSAIQESVQSSHPGWQPPPRPSVGQIAGALGKGAKDYAVTRYGSLDALGNTLYTDPLGAAMDASAVLGGTGGIVRTAGAMGKLPAAVRAGAALTSAADIVNPVSVIPAVGKGLNRLTSAPREVLASKFMGAALNPPVSMPPDKAAQMTQTALTEGIPASRKGYEKARSVLGDLQADVDAMVARGEQLGLQIDPVNVADYLSRNPLSGKSTRQLFSEQVNPSADTRAIDAAVKEYLAKYTPPQPQASGLLGPTGQPLPPPPALPPQPYGIAEAQAEKSGTYRNLKKKAYGELKSADVEAQKSLAHGLRNEIANELTNAGIPGINELNKREGKLIDLMDQLETVIAKEQKAPPGQIAGPLWAGAAGGVVGGQVGLAGPVGATAALLRYTATHPEFGSKLALAISSKSPQKYPGIRAALSALRHATPVASRAINLAEAAEPYLQSQ